MAAKHPKSASADGASNDFRIIDHVTKAMRQAGIPPGEIEKFCDEAISGEDRDLLEICQRWVTVVPCGGTFAIVDGLSIPTSYNCSISVRAYRSTACRV